MRVTLYSQLAAARPGEVYPQGTPSTLLVETLGGAPIPHVARVEGSVIPLQVVLKTITSIVHVGRESLYLAISWP